MRNLIVIIAILAVAHVAQVGCDQGPETRSEANASSDAIPAALVLSSAPANAQDVKAAKANLKPGDEVVLHGVIGGRVDPIASNRAILTVIDPSLQTCDKMGGGDDHCKTPWDACCEDQDTVTRAAATVQVVNDKGQPLKVGLNGHKGIAPGKDVTVAGKVRSADEKNLVVDATGIYVKS
jgi:hypothetical protein